MSRRWVKDDLLPRGGVYFCFDLRGHHDGADCLFKSAHSVDEILGIVYFIGADIANGFGEVGESGSFPLAVVPL